MRRSVWTTYVPSTRGKAKRECENASRRHNLMNSIGSRRIARAVSVSGVYIFDLLGLDLDGVLDNNILKASPHESGVVWISDG
ncbi:hypothetical protein RB195_010051 [Necator americanus]|uniref:Uncharacterized protein n=1 Tax=Necator americanus TaxID=51031 RepID=A0ABR1CW81_NECAM